MAVDDTKPLVGGCFEELAEGAEFDVYEKYADDMLKPNCRERLNTLLQRSDVLHTFTVSIRGITDLLQLIGSRICLKDNETCQVHIY